MSEYKPVLDKARQRALKHLDDTNGWKTSSKSTDILKIESKPSDVLNCSIYRTTQWVRASPQVVVDTYIVSPDSKRREWDSDMREVVVLKDVSETIKIQQITTNPVAKGVISPREFVDIVQVTRDGDNITVVGGSIPDYKTPPSNEKYVRGMTACFLVSATVDPSDPKRTKVVTITEMDLKGRIPRALLDSVIPTLNVTATDKWRTYLSEKSLLLA